MFRKKPPHPLLWLIVIFTTLFTLLGYTVASAGAKKDVSAKAATLYEPTTKRFIYSKNSDLRLPMASTTKIMTAIVAKENSLLDETCKINEEAVGIEGSSAYLKEGELYTIEELLYALLLQSANDAAVAIAYHVAGGISEFAELMNNKAADLGLSNTHFSNPHGLDDDEHYTTASDLAIIAAELLSDQDLSAIVSTYKKKFVSEDRQRAYVNHNKLLLGYDGAIGIKTGFTKKSGRCLVGAANRDGLSLITVTLNAPNDWNDHKALFDFGFSSIERITFTNPEELSYKIPVISGTTDYITVTNTEGASVIVPKGEHKIESYLKLHRYVSAPVYKDTPLGEMIYTIDGNEAARVILYSKDEIPLPEKKNLLDWFKNILN